ncbi:hypothetical protein AB0933_10255 [Streptomyces venezuelae]|uniref:hypothetical protein n=1 Tax=Streptomyces venezuelae TaxID=54571 RepID=UPI003452EDF1
MERDDLMRLLADDDEASAAALAALRIGAAYVVWDGAYPSEPVAHTYARRFRYTQRRGTETLGLERAVQLLRQRDQPVCLGQVTAADKSWTFTLFLAADGESLVACTGVRRVAV